MAQAGECVVITGASAGIGRATAREFAPRGSRVALLARGEDRLRSAAREVEELGGEALAIPVDVADAEAVEAAAERVAAEFGPIDIWINNAFAGMFARFLDMSGDEFRRINGGSQGFACWRSGATQRRAAAAVARSHDHPTAA